MNNGNSNTHIHMCTHIHVGMYTYSLAGQTLIPPFARESGNCSRSFVMAASFCVAQIKPLIFNN